MLKLLDGNKDDSSARRIVARAVECDVHKRAVQLMAQGELGCPFSGKIGKRVVEQLFEMEAVGPLREAGLIEILADTLRGLERELPNLPRFTASVAGEGAGPPPRSRATCCGGGGPPPRVGANCWEGGCRWI